MSSKKKSEIILEVGTNELGVLEFLIAGNSYGINVAKIRDLMKYEAVQPMPRSQPFIEGIFQPRQEVITVIDLAGYMGLGPSSDPTRDILIIAGFNKIAVAFHVHSVECIHRLSWQAIEKPDSTIYGGTEGIVTGIAKVKDRIIAIIDFEKIVYDISPATGIQMSEIEALGQRANTHKPVLIAEDSSFLRTMLLDALHRAGYDNVIANDNGQEAWDVLRQLRDADGPIEEKVGCIITDIEMPQMDGHRLTKLVKEDPKLKKLPVIIFSSLIDETMRLKGQEVGANAQLSKPEIGNLVGVVDSLIL